MTSGKAPVSTVFAELFSAHGARSATSDTIAIRELVLGSIQHGAKINGIFRPLPMATFIRRLRRIGSNLPFPVIDVPKVAVRARVAGVWCRTLAPQTAMTEVAICHMVGGFELAQQVFAGRPTQLVLVVHNSDLRTPGLHDALQAASLVYCRSEAVKRQLAKLASRACDGVVFSGVPEAEFVSEVQRCSEGEVRLVSAASLVPLKNLDAVIRGLKLVAGEIAFRYDIFGDGPARASLENLANEVGMQDRIHFHGFRPRIEVLAAMRMAQIFAMPSAPETLGLAFLEAMSQGCVTIGHKGWGVDGIVTDGRDGFLVQRADPELIAQTIRRYLRADRNTLHENSLQLARRYTSTRAFVTYAEMMSNASQ